MRLLDEGTDNPRRSKTILCRRSVLHTFSKTTNTLIWILQPVINSSSFLQHSSQSVFPT